MVIQDTTVPVWAMTLKTQDAARLKYQSLVDGVRRRLLSAIEQSNQPLILALRQELAELEREI
jgi:hypothetical protein